MEGKGSFFHDSSGFTLDLTGCASSLKSSFADVTSEESEKISACMDMVSRMESGEHVNVSEDRCVDHYNHRMEEELVPGKSLSHSLQLWRSVCEAVNDIIPTVDNVLFNGIGGSYLGPYLLLSAIPHESTPSIHFVSNTDPESLNEVLKKCEPSRTIMVHVSKSGSTAETAGNMEAHRLWAGTPREMAVTVKNSPLYKLSSNFEKVFCMDTSTGGRVSVVSAVGMIPAAFARLDFEQFLRGQSYMDEMTRRREAVGNPAMMIALTLERVQVGMRKNMIFLGYSDALREYAHYLQQLYMESLGKEHSSDGGRVLHEGQTVFGGVGTGEQHAFMQQVQKGLHDAVVRFVSFRVRSVDYPTRGAGSMGRQMLGFVRGTQSAMMKNGRPFISQVMERCDMFNMGMLIALEERVVSFLAVMKGVNAYDQPGVQDGKEAATQMNDLGKKIVSILVSMKKGTVFEGTAKRFVHHFMSDVKPRKMFLFDSDAILSDIEANINVENSYETLRGKIDISRRFEDGRFVYRVEKLLHEE